MQRDLVGPSLSLFLVLSEARAHAPFLPGCRFVLFQDLEHLVNSVFELVMVGKGGDIVGCKLVLEHPLVRLAIEHAWHRAQQQRSKDLAHEAEPIALV